MSLQISQNVNFGNRLSRAHVEFESKKMNVRIAAETLSNSVATSIEYLNTVLEDETFRESEATVQYFRVFNNLFDVMNTKRNHCDGKYKQPISEATIDSFRDYFEFAKNYIKGLKLVEDGKKISILKSKSFTPYCGYYNNMRSFLGIYEDYLKPAGISEFYTFDVSQDHLESFFGCIRRMGGKQFFFILLYISRSYRCYYHSYLPVVFIFYNLFLFVSDCFQAATTIQLSSNLLERTENCWFKMKLYQVKAPTV